MLRYKTRAEHVEKKLLLPKTEVLGRLRSLMPNSPFIGTQFEVDALERYGGCFTMIQENKNGLHEYWYHGIWGEV